MASLPRPRSLVFCFFCLAISFIWLTAATALPQEQEGTKGIKSEEVVPRAPANPRHKEIGERRRTPATSSVRRYDRLRVKRTFDSG